MDIPAILPAGFAAQEWPARRAQLLKLFGKEVYGVTPELSGVECRCQLEEELVLEDGRRREGHRLFFTKDGHTCDMAFALYLPAQAAGPLPCVLVIDSFGRNRDVPRSAARTEQLAPYREVTARGWALAHVHVDDLCLDEQDRWQQDLLRLLPRRGESGWGAIGVWAWGASRVIDVLCADARFDGKKIAVAGCSRSGKAALWCGAQDERVAVTISNVSGCTGAAVTRGKTGEHIRDITGTFPHWLCPKYASYAEREEQLPLDQHMLLALCAPRPLYVSSASEDSWADPAKEFEACVLAGEAYRLLGAKGLCSESFPPVDTPLLDGDIAYHVRTGAHGCRLYDWEQYLAFLARYF